MLNNSRFLPQVVFRHDYNKKEKNEAQLKKNILSVRHQTVKKPEGLIAHYGTTSYRDL